MSRNMPIHSPPSHPIFVEERSPKNRILTFTLACLGGYLGLHRFYTGRFWTGLLMLLTSGGFAIWWIFDVLLVLSGRFKDGEGRVLGPPRRTQGPAGYLPQHTSHRPPGAQDDDIDLDALLEDPLEEKFRELERQQQGRDGSF